jgi:surface-anchored protein
MVALFRFAIEVFLELVGIRGPGTFSIWNTDSFGGPNVLLATSIDQNGPLALLADSHVHYNWALSQPGQYELDFRAYGFIGGQPSESEVATFTLDAQAQAIPEPASLAIFGLALAPLLARRLRNKA